MKTLARTATTRGLRARWSTLVAAGLLIVATGPGPIEAQVLDSTSARVGCFQGAPLPACASFWLVELQGSTTLVAPSYWVEGADHGFRVDESGAQYELTLGHMANLNATWALGGGVSVGSGADDLFTGARGRVRRWLSPDLSVEFELGVARGGGSVGWYRARTGISSGLRFNIQDYGSAFVRYDGFGSVSPDDFFGGYDPDFTGSRHFVRGGVGFGSRPAAVVTGVLAVGYLVLVGIVLSSGGWT